MQTLVPFLATSGQGAQAPAMLIIIFWMLIILCALGQIGIGYVSAENRPGVVTGTSIVSIILFAILGYYTFGF